MCHTAARTSPMTTTRREMRRSNLGVAKNSRIAKRYAIPAIVNEAMKYVPPRSPKLREQMVSATHNVAPSRYTLHSGVILTSFRCPSATVLPHVPTLLATPPCVAPLQEPAATPLPSESGRQPYQYRRRDLRNLRLAQELARVIGVSRAHCWCPFRPVRTAQDEQPL